MDSVKKNSVKKNTVKGGVGAIATVIATATVEVAAAAARTRGIEIDGTVRAGVVAAVTGVLIGIIDFFKHRRAA